MIKFHPGFSNHWGAFGMAKYRYVIVKEGRREEGETLPYYLIVAV